MVLLSAKLRKKCTINETKTRLNSRDAILYRSLKLSCECGIGTKPTEKYALCMRKSKGFKSGLHAGHSIPVLRELISEPETERRRFRD